MKILSWNVNYKNKRYQEILEFIKRENPDIVCLQEVNQELLEILIDEYGKHLAYTVDFFEGTFPYYLVVISNLQGAIISEHELNSDKYFQNEFSKKPSLIQKIFSWKEALNYQTCTFEFANKKIVIFNLHLTNGNSYLQRFQEFEFILLNKLLLKNEESKENELVPIITGDFNTFQRNSISWFLFWLYGIKIRDLLVDEKFEFLKLLQLKSLKDLLPLNQSTQKIFIINSKLDYIITPKDFVAKGYILKQSFGSDHFPCFCEFKD